MCFFQWLYFVLSFTKFTIFFSVIDSLFCLFLVYWSLLVGMSVWFQSSLWSLRVIKVSGSVTSSFLAIMYIGFDYIVNCCFICFLVISMYRLLQQLYIVSRFYSLVVFGFWSFLIWFRCLCSLFWKRFGTCQNFIFWIRSTTSFSNSFSSCIMGSSLVDMKPYASFWSIHRSGLRKVLSILYF